MGQTVSVQIGPRAGSRAPHPVRLGGGARGGATAGTSPPARREVRGPCSRTVACGGQDSLPLRRQEPGGSRRGLAPRGAAPPGCSQCSPAGGLGIMLGPRSGWGRPHCPGQPGASHLSSLASPQGRGPRACPQALSHRELGLGLARWASGGAGQPQGREQQVWGLCFSSSVPCPGAGWVHSAAPGGGE